MKLDLTLKTAMRVSKARMKVYTVSRRVRRLSEDEVAELRAPAVYLFNQAELYVVQNAGSNPPSDAKLWFGHNEKTADYIRIAAKQVRRIWNLIPPSKQKEAAGAHREVVQMLKDLAAHVSYWRKWEARQ